MPLRTLTIDSRGSQDAGSNVMDERGSDTDKLNPEDAHLKAAPAVCITLDGSKHAGGIRKEAGVIGGLEQPQSRPAQLVMETSAGVEYR